eukprot:TRINITY_DN47075_c0_g1_i1.p1 TRINITY_DN47075_c0_g1~~TRINITY_DN47075_c0_g1_i1.p1  ORF type:complete len:650 (+),score=67.69 TRINITY_DN47075_c0_g1_i1:49-1950(+)
MVERSFSCFVRRRLELGVPQQRGDDKSGTKDASAGSYGFFLQEQLLREVGSICGDSEMLVAWSESSAAPGIHVLVAPLHGMLPSMQLDNTESGSVTFAPLLRESNQPNIDALYSLCAVPLYWLPLVDAIVLEVACDGEGIDSRALQPWYRPGVVEELRRQLIECRAVVRSGSRVTWRSPCGSTLAFNAYVQLRRGQVEQVQPISSPSTEWHSREWVAWLQEQRVGILGDFTHLTVLPSGDSPRVLQSQRSTGQLDSKRYNRSAQYDEAALDSIIHSAFYPGTRGEILEHVALVLGSWPEAFFRDSLSRMDSLVYVAVLSASDVFAEATALGADADLAAVRRAILLRVSCGVPAVVVLMRPADWFRTDRSEDGLLSVLRQISQALEYQSAWRDSSVRPAVTVVGCFDVEPPKPWRSSGIFSHVIQLEEQLRAPARWTDSQKFAPGNREVSGGDAAEATCASKVSVSVPDAQVWLSQLREYLAGSCANDGGAPEGEAGTRLAQCVAFFGPEGCGKSSLLRALAQEDHLQVLPLEVPTILNAGVGDTQAAVRALFERAAHMRPACVTLDDADVLFAGCHASQTMADLLVEIALMIECHCSSRLLFVATCNAPSKLPAALMSRLQAIPVHSSAQLFP